MGELIAVLSGKGGTGKTSVCAGLAAALASMGESVLCIDCDVGLRNLDIALGLGQMDALSFRDVCDGRYSLDQALRHPDFEKLRFLTAPVGCTADDVDKERFARLLWEAKERFRYVLLDAPAGIERGFELAAFQADRVILVTCPEPGAIRDAAQTAQRLERMGKSSVRLIVNRINKALFASMGLTVDDVMDEAGLPLLGIVPEDIQVTLAAAFGKSLLTYSRKGAAAAFKRIAKRIQGMPEPIRFR